MSWDVIIWEFFTIGGPYDLGQIGDVREEFCEGLAEENKVNGSMRYLSKFLQILASFYLTVEQETGEELLWFGEPNIFQVVLGGDGAPFGKDDTACSWFVSFLNKGKHLLRSNENFLIFVSNSSDNSVIVKRYVAKLMKEISEIENSTFIVNGAEIKFIFSEFPNDLKMMTGQKSHRHRMYIQVCSLNRLKESVEE